MNTLLDRIEINPAVMVGKPVIKGTRLTVTFILGLLSHGETTESIIQEHPNITSDDIYACIDYASEIMKDTTFIPLPKQAA